MPRVPAIMYGPNFVFWTSGVPSSLGSTAWGKSSGLHCWNSAPLCAYSWYCTRRMLVTTSWQSMQEPPALHSTLKLSAFTFDWPMGWSDFKASQTVPGARRFCAASALGRAPAPRGSRKYGDCFEPSWAFVADLPSRLVPPPPPPGADCFLKESLLWPVNLTVRQVCFCFLVQSWLPNGMGTDWSAEIPGFNPHRNNQHSRHTSLSCPVLCCRLAA